MGLYPKEIMTPEHTIGVKSEAEYRRQQQQAITRGRAKFPKLNWRNPHVVTPNPPVYIDGGRWALRCSEECGNIVLVHPGWGLGLCFECGAVYEGLALPDGHEDATEILVARAHPSLRGWAPGESIDRLLQENAHLEPRGLATPIPELRADIERRRGNGVDRPV
jgi:hypothetical protein